MPVKVLNVAEKPSVAKEVSRILSNGGARSRRGRSQYNPIWDFCYTINGSQCDMVFTSVAGHLMELEFPTQYKKWRGCSPLDLYTAPVIKDVPNDKQHLKEHLQQLARQCQWLVLWLDCDREGENISFEVIDVCQSVNRHLRILRARFSALIPRELQRALQNLVAPNAADAAAVDARQEIDLRIGASFTRLQTLLLQDKFDWLAGGLDNEKPLLSYGPCQFPTLGLIVQRAWEIQSHVAEPFWLIHVSYRPPAEPQQQQHQQPQQPQPGCDFKWTRDRLFDVDVATMLYEECVQQPTATVMQVRGRQTIKRAPVPLATLEMCKTGSSQLRLSGERIMKLAEELYQAGFISYPRTETDVYDPGMDLRAIVAEHTNDARWGGHASAILAGHMWKPPRDGGHDDKAHPPIHPTRYSAGEGNWSAEKKLLYEFIVRHFLASCSKDAVGFETTVTVDIAGELFKTTGLMVTERNWLLVYRWASWGGNSNLPAFVEGQQFQPSELTLRQGATAPPPRLSERDLIAAMERHGIGTDATMAEHIQKQIERGYAEKDAQLAFWPTPLGECLISSYRRMGLDNLWKPDLRGRIEEGISRIAAGQVSKDQILQQAVGAFRVDFQAAMQRTQVMLEEVSRFFQRVDGGGQQPPQHQAPPGHGGGGGGGGGPPGHHGGGGGGGPGGQGPGGGLGGAPGPGSFPHQGVGHQPNATGGTGGGGDGSTDDDGDLAGGAARVAPPNTQRQGGAGGGAVGQPGQAFAGGNPAQQQLGPCPRCGSRLLLVQTRQQASVARVRCAAEPLCSFNVQLPRAVTSANVVLEQRCGSCSHGSVQLVKMRFIMHLLPPGLFLEPEHLHDTVAVPLTGAPALLQSSATTLARALAAGVVEAQGAEEAVGPGVAAGVVRVQADLVGEEQQQEAGGDGK
eukprot:gene13627-13753_t